MFQEKSGDLALLGGIYFPYYQGTVILVLRDHCHDGPQYSGTKI